MYTIGVCNTFKNSFKNADLTMKSTKDITLEKVLSLGKNKIPSLQKKAI